MKCRSSAAEFCLKLTWRPYRKGIFQADVPGAKEGKLSFDQLFVDGRRQHLARYPNYNASVRPYGGCAEDCISPARIKGWSNPTTGIVHAIHASYWGSMDYRITGVDDEGNARLEGGWQNNRPTPPSGRASWRTFLRNSMRRANGFWIAPKVCCISCRHPAWT